MVWVLRKGERYEKLKRKADSDVGLGKWQAVEVGLKAFSSLEG